MADRPVEVVYFYRTKWGHHDEFLELFTRNHLPVLHEQVKSGRMLDVRVQVPRFHGDGRADWDVMVTIVVSTKPTDFCPEFYRVWGPIANVVRLPWTGHLTRWLRVIGQTDQLVGTNGVRTTISMSSAAARSERDPSYRLTRTPL